MENPIKMDDLGENPLFSETSIYKSTLPRRLKFPQASSALACHVVSEGLAFDLTAAKKLDGLR